eukprot:TRINITY_DN2528_c0_g1_i1.p1 TRINITY_DN2528_c0_g1~~TRINITY_DN2528_c0_g1_i1.p1  ORF type:complete len:748 (-),score=161.84 TRINITY_DN2528_c0_g1_i1:116-2359(-)
MDASSRREIKRSLTPTRIVDDNDNTTLNNHHHHHQGTYYNTIVTQSNEDTTSKKLKSTYSPPSTFTQPSSSSASSSSSPPHQTNDVSSNSYINDSALGTYSPDEITTYPRSHLVFPNPRTHNQTNCNTNSTNNIAQPSNQEKDKTIVFQVPVIFSLHSNPNVHNSRPPSVARGIGGLDDDSPFSLPPGSSNADAKYNNNTMPPFIFPDMECSKRSDSHKPFNLPSLPPISTIFALQPTVISTTTMTASSSTTTTITTPPTTPPQEDFIDHFELLPNETILNILKYLSLTDFFRVSQVSRKLSAFSDVESIWAQFLKDKLEEIDVDDWSNYITTINTKVMLSPNKLKVLKALGSNNEPMGKSKREYAMRLKNEAMWQIGNPSFQQVGSNFGRVCSLALWGQNSPSGHSLAICGHSSGVVNIIDTNVPSTVAEISQQNANEALPSVLHIQSNTTGMLCGYRDGWLRQYNIDTKFSSSSSSSSKNSLQVSTQFLSEIKLVRTTQRPVEPFPTLPSNINDARPSPLPRLLKGMATEPTSHICAAFYGEDDGEDDGGNNEDLEREIDIFNTRDGLLLRTLREDVESGAVSCIGSNPLNHLISGSNNGVVKIWDCETGSPIFSVSAHQNRVNCVSLLDNRHIAISGSADGEVTVFDERAGPNYVRCFTHPKRIVLSFYATQTKLLVGLKTPHNTVLPSVAYWDPRIVPSNIPLHSFRDQGNSYYGSVVSIISDDSKIVAGRSQGYATFWGFND